MSFLAYIAKAVIYFYRYIISPILPGTCRFQPTCSAYALQAIEKYGPVKGSKLGLLRILRCHPWGRWGYDPVPEPNESRSCECRSNGDRESD